jgi:acyl carrier protein
MMEINKKLELLYDIFEAEEGEIDVDTELATLPNWDSMTKLSLIIMMDDECKKELRAEQVRAFKTVKDILDFMD